MKKIIALLSVLCIIVSLCGCAKETEETSVTTWTEGGGSTTPENNDSTGGDKKADSSKADEAKYLSGNQNISNPLSANLGGASVTVYETGNFFKVNSSSSKSNQSKILNFVIYAPGLFYRQFPIMM